MARFSFHPQVNIGGWNSRGFSAGIRPHCASSDSALLSNQREHPRIGTRAICAYQGGRA